MLDHLPLVTVNILSFNRKDELRNTLTKVYEQDYKNIEVIVVDNASSDGSPEMVANEFPTVILIRMQKNIGIAGWNEGFKIARGEYVLVLDDDSYPENDTIKNGLSVIKLESVGVVAFDIFNKYSQEFETKYFQSDAFSFIGCGALIKKEMFCKIGYYNEDYHLYNNELDFSIRMHLKGFKIQYLKNSVVVHDFVKKDLLESNPYLSRNRYYYFFISQATFIIQNFSKKEIVFILFKWIINRMLICINFNYWKEFLSAMHFIVNNYSHNKLKRRDVPVHLKKNS